MLEWLNRVVCLHLECLPVYGAACLLICPISVAFLATVANLLWGGPTPPRDQPNLSQEALDAAVALWPGTSEAHAEVRGDVVCISLTYEHCAGQETRFVLSQDTLQMTVDFFSRCVTQRGYKPFDLDYFVVQSTPDRVQVDLYLREIYDQGG